jgi:hypothetical protein
MTGFCAGAGGVEANPVTHVLFKLAIRQCSRILISQFVLLRKSSAKQFAKPRLRVSQPLGATHVLSPTGRN